jgi:hypothetical protein
MRTSGDFLNFQNAPLLRCHHFHFPRSDNKNILKNKNFWSDIYYFFVALVVLRGLLNELLIPICPLF